MTPEYISKFIADIEGELVKDKRQVKLAVSLDELKATALKYQGEDRVVSSLELAELIKNRPEEPVILSGFPGLDMILKGFKTTQLVTISAPTKNGKTSFCIDLTTKMKDHHPLWFPFEEPAEELISKFLERKEEVPLFFTPEHVTGNTLHWLEKKIIESIAKYGTKVVFIDHLHFIIEMTHNNMSLEIGQTMRALKQMAKRWDILIFIIAHLGKTKLEMPPDINDIRDSSFVAQEADTVIMLWRETYRENDMVNVTENVLVSVQANRRTGKTGNVKMIYHDGHFVEKHWNTRGEKAAKKDKEWADF